MKFSPLVAAVALLALAALDASVDARTIRRGDSRYTYVERVYVTQDIPEYVTGEIPVYVTGEVADYVTSEIPVYITRDIPEYVTREVPTYDIRIIATATRRTFIPLNTLVNRR